MSHDQKTRTKESWENFREWVATALNDFLAPDGLIATDQTIDTLAQVLECRVKEVNGELLAACKALFAKPTDGDVNRDYTDFDAALDRIRSAVANAESQP